MRLLDDTARDLYLEARGVASFHYLASSRTFPQRLVVSGFGNAALGSNISPMAGHATRCLEDVHLGF